MVKLHGKRTRSPPAYTLTTHRHQKMTYTAFYVASAVSQALDASGFLTNGFSKACTGQKESTQGGPGQLRTALCSSVLLSHFLEDVWQTWELACTT